MPLPRFGEPPPHTLCECNHAYGQHADYDADYDYEAERYVRCWQPCCVRVPEVCDCKDFFEDEDEKEDDVYSIAQDLPT